MGQLAGTWVGTVGQSRLDRLQDNLPPDGGSHYAVLLTFRTQFFGQREYMTGHLSACSPMGRVSTADFDDVWVLNDGVAPLQARNWTGKLKFDYPAIRFPGTATSVLPEDSADTEGYRLSAYTYGDPPVAEVSEDVAGRLHRGTKAEFETLCRSLRKSAVAGQPTSAASPSR